jgi:hypothetical protein
MDLCTIFFALQKELNIRLLFCGMFTKEEASRIRAEFWTTFGRYMSAIPSSEGKKINWVNFHTGVKDVYFRMEAGPKSASISISLEHQDLDIQEIYFGQLSEFSNLLHDTLGEPWQWELHAQHSGRIVSRVSKTLQGISVFDKNNWAELISFFKPRIIALDTFWENAKYSFDSLR